LGTVKQGLFELWEYGVNSDGQGIVFKDETMYVDCKNLVEKFKRALRNYIEYLKLDTDYLNGSGIPSIRWKKGFWYSLKPVYMNATGWIKLGLDNRIY